MKRAPQRRFLIAAWAAGVSLAGAQTPPPAPTAESRARVDPAAAQVEAVDGRPTVRLPATAAGGGSAPLCPVLAAGSPVPEGARIQVPDDGYLQLRLADGSVVRVLAGSDVELRRMRMNSRTGRFEARLDVRRGTVESDVVPCGVRRIFEIRAPGAVASVRGTRFVVSVDAGRHVATQVTEGCVLVRPRHRRGGQATFAPTTLGPGESLSLILGGDARSATLRALPAGR